jgi:hypothetical protein
MITLYLLSTEFVKYLPKDSGEDPNQSSNYQNINKEWLKQPGNISSDVETKLKNEGLLKQSVKSSDGETELKAIHDLEKARKKSRKRLGIITLNAPPKDQEYFNWSITNHKKYAKKHGYINYIEVHILIALLIIVWHIRTR